MRFFILLFIIGMMYESNAQHQIKFALTLNIAKLPYQCYELNTILSAPDKKYQILGTFNYTHGTTNYNQKRNMVKFDEAFMTRASDDIEGYGFGVQLRAQLKESLDLNSKFRIYIGLGYNHSICKVNFMENEYIEDQPPFYHFKLVPHNEKLIYIAPDLQLIFNYSPNIFFAELGVGVAYKKAFIPNTLEKYRNYHLSQMDYGYTGWSPIISMRLGAWIL